MPDYERPYECPWNNQKDKIKKVVINNGVENIGECAFCDCYNLTSITIPNSVTNIGYGAFWGCKNLISVVIPNSVTSIGASAFRDCKSLKSFTIPNSVTKIKEETFYQCESLTSVTIPSSVIDIGSWAFYACEKLTSITDLAETPQTRSIHNCPSFEYVYNATLHVLPGCKEKYERWNELPLEMWGKRQFKIVEDATTGIDVVKDTPTISSDKIFSISGQQLNKTKKGVNIINGKKILVK